MSRALPRRFATGMLLGLLAGASGLALAPGDAGAVRLGGMSLLWWYSVVAAPVVAIAVAAVALTGRE